MIVVADAIPIIFLGKLQRLDLISKLLRGTVFVPSAVRDEILAPPIPPAETHLLSSFLEKCTVEKVARLRPFASALSRADNAALTLAVRKRADVLLADDGLLREIAVVEGIRPLGTLGVLPRAMRKGLLTAEETRRFVEELVREHNFRIGIEVYEAVLDQISQHQA